MQEYRTISVTVRAVRITDDMFAINQDGTPGPNYHPIGGVAYRDKQKNVATNNNSGSNIAGVGDWLVFNDDGSIVPVSDYAFKAKYEQVSGNAGTPPIANSDLSAAPSATATAVNAQS